jgi:N-acyl-D-amino-acid deacylase
MIPIWIVTAAFVGAPLDDETIRTAAAKGLKRLESAAVNYTKNRACFSCHHQTLPVLALAAGKKRGFVVGDDVLPKQIKFTLDTFSPRLKTIRDGSGIGGANTTAGYALITLEVTKHPRDTTTDALVEFLLKNQHKDGFWRPTTVRPPSEGSPFTSTALALQGLKRYAPDDDDDELDDRLKQAREKGLAYLKRTKAETTEDHIFRLWGLVVGGAGEGDVAEAKAALLKLQRPDGGWAQLAGMKSDAYATGSALAALRIVGVAPTDQAYRRAVRFLLLTQHESGAWIVTTRSKPIQKLFDNGDPGGTSQFISTAATGWAVLALVEAVEKK